MAVPYTFGNATSSIPLSQLDNNFATAITIGNTAVQLGNTITTVNNLTLANVSIASGNATITTLTAPTHNSASSLTFQTNGTTTAMTINTSGNVGIGTTSAGYILDIVSSDTTNGFAQRIRSNSTATKSRVQFTNNSASSQNAYIEAGDSPYLAFGGSSSESMRLTNSGHFLIGIGASDTRNFNYYGQEISWQQPSSTTMFINLSDTSGNNGSTQGLTFRGLTSSGSAQTNLSFMNFNTTSAVFAGSISKGSGSFRIEHPLPSLNSTHQLVHSFIEGPRIDLIYRGTITLVNGTATVDIDQSAGMTEGTFVVLCREAQCFTTNETDWDAVKGSVLGNKLTITCQNPSSTATISWMVIAERQDPHIINTDWTDSNGKIIIEPLKPELKLGDLPVENS